MSKDDDQRGVPDEALIEADLQKRWREFFQRTAADGAADEYFNELRAQYNGRDYHSLRHIHHGLTELDDVRAQDLLSRQEADRVEMAFWFHDYFYETAAETAERTAGLRRSIPEKNNEERSADFAADVVINRMHLGVGYAQDVERLILLTQHEKGILPEASDRKGRYMIDIDFAILGQQTRIFDRYEDAIRREYRQYPDDAFYPGRKAVVEGFLARDSIYLTDHFKNKYEKKARSNLARSVTRWSNLPGSRK